MNKHFHLENYLTWFALNILLDNKDSINKNFYLYSPSKSQGWYFLPWDYDGAWGYYTQPSRSKLLRKRWSIGISNWWGNDLHELFLQQEGNLAKLQQKITFLAESVFQIAKTEDLINNYPIRPSILTDPDLGLLPTLFDSNAEAEINTEYQRIPSVIEKHLQIFNATLENPMPFWMGTPKKESANVWAFRWGHSFDLQGDDISYDLQLSLTPNFEDIYTINRSVTDALSEIDFSSEQISYLKSHEFEDSDSLIQFIETKSSQTLNNEQKTNITQLALEKAGEIYKQKLDIIDNKTILTGIETGNYFWRVIARDNSNPQQHWQIAFDTYEDDNNRQYFGVDTLVAE
jgi:hypothetical protein